MAGGKSSVDYVMLACLLTNLTTRNALSLPVAAALEGLVLDHLNPVAIRVQYKCHVPHATISQALLPVDVQALETSAGCVEVINRDT